MSTGILQEKPRASGTLGGGPGDIAPEDGGRGDGAPGFLGDTALFGLWAFLGTVSMLFIGFTSAYLIRRTSADWVPVLRRVTLAVAVSPILTVFWILVGLTVICPASSEKSARVAQSVPTLTVLVWATYGDCDAVNGWLPVSVENIQ